MSRATDVEISRALNALATTLSDQRAPRFEVERFQRIVDGALAGERKLKVIREGDDHGQVRHAGGGGRVATVRQVPRGWVCDREVDAKGSTWAIPQPEAG